jgi:luciferase family oxidoreductase group 1
MIKLGLLEFGIGEEKASPKDILQNVIDNAQTADELGFSRFWLTEHHNLSPAWNNPEMLLPILAGITDNIRIGVAGILLASHSPYRVAQSFKLLANLFPGRIDLGLANGKTSFKIAQYLSNDSQLKDDFHLEFDARLLQLANFLRKEGAFIDQDVVITPHPGEIPEIWNLRSTYRNLPFSLENDLNYSRSVFHGKLDIFYEKEMLFKYREDYLTKYNKPAMINLSFAGVCSKTTAQANKRYAAGGHKNDQYPYNCIVGSPELFFDRISYISEELKIDEFIFTDLDQNAKERGQTLYLLSDIFKLTTVLA